MSIDDVANTLRLLVAGGKGSDYNEKGEQYEVHVRAAAEFRNSQEELLASFSVPATHDRVVALRDVVKLAEGVGPAEINRLSRKRQVTISANMTPGASQQTLLDAIERSVREIGHGAGLHERTVGQVEGDGADVPQLLHRLPQRHPLRLPGHRGAVRVVAAPDHDPPVAALDAAVCAALAALLPTNR